MATFPKELVATSLQHYTVLYNKLVPVPTSQIRTVRHINEQHKGQLPVEAFRLKPVAPRLSSAVQCRAIRVASGTLCFPNNLQAPLLKPTPHGVLERCWGLQKYLQMPPTIISTCPIFPGPFTKMLLVWMTVPTPILLLTVEQKTSTCPT
jgi:hypothetical protein